MPNTTTTEIPSAVSAYYDRNLLTRAVPSFIHQNFAQIRDLPRNSSEVIKFRKYANLTAATTPLTQGVTPTGSQLSASDITATVAQYGDFVTLTDFLLFTTLDPILFETADILGDQAGDTLDQLTRDVITAGTTVQYASTAVSRVTVAAGMLFTKVEAKKAVRTLKNNKARKITGMVNPSTGFNTMPLNRAFVALTHPNVVYDMKEATGWTPVERYASPENAFPNEVGAIDEVRIIESPNAKLFAGAGAGAIDVYPTMVLGMEAYGISRVSGESLRMIVKQLGSAGTADPLEQRATSGWKASFVAKRLQETWMVRVETAVSS